MPGLSPAEAARTSAAMARHRTPNGGYRLVALAKELGIAVSSVQNRIRRIQEGRYGAAPEPEALAESPQAQRRETQDADFWKRRAKALETELAAAENLVTQLSGLVGRPLDPPPFLLAQPGGTLKKSAGLLHISDVHAGEVVKADEVLGINAYNLDICQRRLRRLFRATIEILPRWSSDTILAGVVVALNGDLVSGAIHEELAETNALTSQQQAWFMADELASGLGALADAFKNVMVVVTPGNHGRQTAKPRFKRAAHASYDTAIGELLRRHFADDKRITFHIPAGRDAVIPILGWTAFITHGDGTLRGGHGFIGPGASIMRGNRLLELALAQVGVEYQIALTAHMHTSINIGKVLANGSVIGVNEYSYGLRGSAEQPRQWLALVTEKYPIRERCDLYLEDPAKPPKPRARVPARTDEP